MSDRLAGMADFITSIRTGVLNDLRELFSESGPVEITRDVLWDVLGPSGLGVLLDGDGNPATSKSAIGVNWYDAGGSVIHAWQPGQLVPIAGQPVQFGGAPGARIPVAASGVQLMVGGTGIEPVTPTMST